MQSQETPNESEDPSPTIPNHRKKEEKTETEEDIHRAGGLGQLK